MRGKKSVTAKECQLLHFVCVCFFVHGKWFSVFMEQSGMGSTKFSDWFISILKSVSNRFTWTWTVSFCVCRVESGLCPRTSVSAPVLSCHVKDQQHEEDSSILIGRLILTVANQNAVRPLQIFLLNVICRRDKMPELHKLRLQTQSEPSV